MIEVEISKRLRAISSEEWASIIKKCYSHIELTLGNKTKYGAHCEQRLGIPVHDFYVGNAIKALYEHSWKWQYEKYDICEQLIRVINSMISNEVRKYKSEKQRNKQLPLLVETINFDRLENTEVDDPPSDDEHYEKCTKALISACEGNEVYLLFVRLKKDGKSYDEICQEMSITKSEAYRLQENIAKKAKRNLKS